MLFRTLLFIPGNNERFIKKSLGLDADILCYDLEDSVPVKEKDVARDLLKMYFREQKIDNIRSSIYVRINSSESGLAKADLLDTVQNGIDGIVLPKIDDSEEVNEVTKIIKNWNLNVVWELDELRLFHQ